MNDSPPLHPARADLWQQLRRLTPARIALGHAGTSLPTRAQLDFQFAHAQARDAVHLSLDSEALAGELGGDCLLLHSAASDRQTYLQRPDLGRRLDDASRAALLQEGNASRDCDLAVVIADGLSALAVQRHAAPLLRQLAERCAAQGLRLSQPCLVQQGRVAVADEIGELLGARASLILIGERPGLSSPDSLGAYLTFAPHLGLTDAARNCVSNIRDAGLSYSLAAHRLHYLLGEALRRGLSGVDLKDESELNSLPGQATEGAGNFLIGPVGTP